MVDNASKIILNGGFFKAVDGKYKAVLSDDSIDRENEIVGKGFLESAFDGQVVGLLDHKNSVMGQVCEWVDKQIIKKDGHNALIATPKWLLSNPNAGIIKNMIEIDKATIGLSIGAIPTDSDTIEIDDKEYKRWTKGEILEASFVAIAANKHAQIQALAKSLDLDKKNKGDIMPDKKVTEKAKEIIDVMKDSIQEDVIKILTAAGVKEDIYKDLVKDIPLTKPKQPSGKEKDDEKKKKEEEDKAQAIIDVMKDAKKEDVIEALKSVNISEDIYKDLVENISGKTNLSSADINKLVDSRVIEKLKETPIFKVQADFMDMTPEQEKDKASEIQKSGQLPIIGREK